MVQEGLGATLGDPVLGEKPLSSPFADVGTPSRWDSEQALAAADRGRAYSRLDRFENVTAVDPAPFDTEEISSPWPEDVGFLAARGYPPALLRRAMRQAALRGLLTADFLLSRNLVAPRLYYRALAAALGVAFIEGDAVKPDRRLAPSLCKVDLRRLTVLALEHEGEEVVLAMAPAAAAISATFDRVARHPQLRRQIRITTPRDLSRAAALSAAVDGLAVARPDRSAASIRMTPGSYARCRTCLLALVTAIASLFLYGPVMALAGAFFICSAAVRFSASLEVAIGDPAIANTVGPDFVWPAYTVLVPLYREAAVVDDLIRGLAKLDYPRDRLDIKLVVEDDDIATRQALERLSLEPPYDILVVPPSRPRTKPKALAYALRFAKGDLVTVYDAEDRPETDQLAKAARAFAHAPASLGCLQAHLAVDHADETFFTRQFALEYATLFDLLLPWLARRHLVLPLGGTSNHFRRRALEDCGGWDPGNVTEDIDIGIRLARDGWALSVLDSSTFEEAPLGFSAWLGQRVRWHKGWLQTFLVHMRHPLRLLRDVGPRDFVVLATLFIGTILALVAHPAFLVLLVSYVIDNGLRPQISNFSDAFVLSAGLVCLLLGYGCSYFAMAMAAHRRRLRIRVSDCLGLPFYWLAMSIAFALALVELVRRPDHWCKTRHGAARHRPATDIASGEFRPTAVGTMPRAGGPGAKYPPRGE